MLGRTGLRGGGVRPGCVAMERKHEFRGLRLLRGVLSVLLLRLAVLAMILAPLLPRGASSATTRQLVHNGIVVVRDMDVYSFGFPLPCAEVHWHHVSAKQAGRAVEVTREIIDAYREVRLSREDPRATVIVVWWGRFIANAVTLIGLLVAGLVARDKWLRHRARERFRQGRCPRCGYDLTGNVTGVCPECGVRVR
jgi:hypothetical protein